MRRALLALLVAAAFGLPGAARADEATLIATVGDDATITLTTSSGAPVTRLAPGTYRILVRDRTAAHNFRLRGPGVDRATSVGGTGDAEWTVTLVDGVYTYLCDPHASTMRGRFTVGTPPVATPPRRLVATVGPGATIAVRTPGGAAVRSTRAGRYAITVRDLSAHHNFRLAGPGVSRATGVAFRGTVTWTVQLRKGATYAFRCDPHARRMRGSFRAV